ncbi:hypothetical protein ACFQHO_04555 [Actinomadura yumaensis]|uniref:hypothetical protein n=1 Tax=Actinomadura yumaensis TaxID=111807 RepID=UPI0036092977
MRGSQAILTNTGRGTAGAPGRRPGSQPGYGLHLDRASWWRLHGFSVAHAKKGIVVDAAAHVTLRRLEIRDVDEEGVHLRRDTTDSMIVGNRVHGTGRTHDEWGEGVYIGSANTNWHLYTGGRPDRSDRNTVSGNVIHGTTAEPIDIKEGTTGAWSPATGWTPPH